MVQACLCGERATWPKLSRIRNHCAVELELDAAVQKLRARVVFSPSQVDLRRMTTGSFRCTTKRVGRKRRDSSGNVQALLKYEDDEDSSAANRKSLSRPPLRTLSTNWTATRKSMPLIPTSSARNSQVTSFPTPQPGDLYSFKFQPMKSRLDVPLQIPDISSGGETAHSPPSSDADIDSHTDESSLEPDIDPAIPGLGLHYDTLNAQNDVVDFFSASQPITSGSDHVLATSPLSTRANIGLLMSGKGGKGTEVCKRKI
jgi:TAG lipase/steryl ester hydrolase/phospholipase A2/LPA acyltransferase